MKCEENQKRATFWNFQKGKHASFSSDSESKCSTKPLDLRKEYFIREGWGMEFVIAGLGVRRTYTSGPKMMNTPCFISQVCLVLINKSAHKKMPEEGTRVWQFTILLECVYWVKLLPGCWGWQTWEERSALYAFCHSSSQFKEMNEIQCKLCCIHWDGYKFDLFGQLDCANHLSKRD